MLGQHELLIRLASGGAANVFLVRDTEAPPPGRLLALKVLLPSLAENEDFLNMFFTEAKIASRLNHPNVVAIAGFGKVRGIHCLAMEYVFGATLAQVLRASARARKPLTVGVLLRITAATCDALHYAHELRDEQGRPMGLVHRDVTPQNILIGFNGTPKLTDFGIAKATNRGWETQAGILKGKFSYMSPEQALGKKVDRRSDIFCAGIVLWEALTGRELFKGSSPIEVLESIRKQPIDPPSKVVKGLSPIVDPIVMKALRRSPRQRYSTALEMRDDIEELIKRAGVTIDNQAISREFAEIFGDTIVNRALALRQAMAGKGELDDLAKALGGSTLDIDHLPEFDEADGLSDPDPLGLFSEPDEVEEEPPAPDEAMPAVAEVEFTRSFPALDIDFDDEEDTGGGDYEDAGDDYEVDPDVESASADGWDDSTRTMVPDDELLSMLSEDDATIGLVPEEFAARFGNQPGAAEDTDDAGFDFDAERTVDASQIPDHVRRGMVRRGGSAAQHTQRASAVAARGMAPANPARRGGEHNRPLPRAPSLDMADDEVETPVPERIEPNLDDDMATPQPILAPSARRAPDPVELAPPIPLEPATLDSTPVEEDDDEPALDPTGYFPESLPEPDLPHEPGPDTDPPPPPMVASAGSTAPASFPDTSSDALSPDALRLLAQETAPAPVPGSGAASFPDMPVPLPAPPSSGFKLTPIKFLVIGVLLIVMGALLGVVFMQFFMS